MDKEAKLMEEGSLPPSTAAPSPALPAATPHASAGASATQAPPSSPQETLPCLPSGMAPCFCPHCHVPPSPSPPPGDLVWESCAT